ncbi:acetylcholine receptor subunit alpha-L1-like [Pomacea canaliculata]|uniref:acetylcholine receptor subunit alpha-L1-like n=1 Tax=Pomacea canaliculata TaxID=400727 RepID=UPI000D72C028|nr:acetylcholine receptor subunit alpha-L1-like [Pomacea canaliculata]
MKDLRQHLLTNYSKHVRPVRHEQTVVVINFSAFLSHLLYLNIKEQVLSTAGSLELVWSDEYLQWNPDQFGNISSVYLPQADVWLPDLVLYNDVNSMKPLRDDNALVVVSNDGTVQWLPGFNANTDCMVDVYRYPFDTQTCSLIFTTWMMTSDHIQVVTETFYTNWSTVNQEYYIASERADPYDETTSYNDYWTQGGNFTLTLKRRVTFHVLSTVLPLLSFSLLTPLAFLVPESGGEKLTLAVSLVLTNQVFLVSLSGSMPTSGDTISLLGPPQHQAPQGGFFRVQSLSQCPV